MSFTNAEGGGAGLVVLQFILLFLMVSWFLQLRYTRINSGSLVIRVLGITFHCPDRKNSDVSNELKRGRSLLS